MIATSAMTAMNHALRYHSSEAARGAGVAGTTSPEKQLYIGYCLFLHFIYLCNGFI